MVHGLFFEDIRSFSGVLIGLHNVRKSWFYLFRGSGLAMYFGTKFLRCNRADLDVWKVIFCFLLPW